MVFLFSLRHGLATKVASGFVAAANMEGINLLKLGAQSAEDVAECGYRAFQGNQAIAVSGFKNKLLAISAKFSPKYLTRKIAMALNQ